MTDTEEMKNLGIKISAKSHKKLKFLAFMEGMSQSAFVEKMIAEYVHPDSQPEPDAGQQFIERAREEGWLPPKKDEATE